MFYRFIRGFDHFFYSTQLEKDDSTTICWCNVKELPAFECPSLGQIECHDKNWNPVPENADLCKVRDM